MIATATPTQIARNEARKARMARLFPGRTVTRQKPKPAPVVVSVAPKPTPKRNEVQERCHVDAYHAWQAWTGAQMTPREFFRAACFLAGYDPELIRSRRDHRRLAEVRLAIIRSIAIRYPKMTSNRIGEVVNRDHTTVLYCMGQTSRSVERKAAQLRAKPDPVSPEVRATVIRMRLKGIPYEEIAKALGIKVTLCWHYMHKYRQALRVKEPDLTASEVMKRAA